MASADVALPKRPVKIWYVFDRLLALLAALWHLRFCLCGRPARWAAYLVYEVKEIRFAWHVMLKDISMNGHELYMSYTLVYYMLTVSGCGYR